MRPSVVFHKYYLLRAQDGDEKAQYRCGKAYLHGWGNATIDHAKALYWFEAAAKKGVLEAQFETACSYQCGKVASPDYRLAVQWYEAVALQLQGHKTLKRNRSRRAIRELATLYEHGGNGLDPNLEKALYWWEQSQAKERNCLGDVCRVRTKMRQYYLELAHEAQGPDAPSAQFRLGRYYMQGSHGFDKNVAEGMRWIEMAAQNGHTSANFQLGCWNKHGHAQYHIKKDATAAQAYLLQAAKAGHADAMYEYGNLFEWGGYGIAKDLRLCLYWVQRAKDHGSRRVTSPHFVSIQARATQLEPPPMAPLQVRVTNDTPQECPCCFGGWNDATEESIYRSTRPIQTECGHLFCLSCLKQLCQMKRPDHKGTCALCRQPILLSKVRYVDFVKDDDNCCNHEVSR
mmetsp:Transcript_14097/g.38944  ORF Transcript_14097/g.38944 Transcript_14097/m.38944 type:complete len:401 (-) Transcript_14097:265-1467(-)